MTPDSQNQSEDGVVPAEAEAAAKLGQLYASIQAAELACSGIACTDPFSGNCWCFNTALAQHVAKATQP